MTIQVCPTTHIPKDSEGAVALLVEGSWMFVGFAGTSPMLPDVTVGFIRAWNLENAQAPPYEFPLSENVPYSHGHTVLSLAVATDASGTPTLFSGAFDGI